MVKIKQYIDDFRRLLAETDKVSYAFVFGSSVKALRAGGEVDILVQGKPVAKVADVMATKGNDIPALRQALKSQNDRVLRREAQDEIEGREITIMGDRDITYRLLKKVMATCMESDYGQISLAVLQKSSDKLANLQAAR